MSGGAATVPHFDVLFIGAGVATSHVLLTFSDVLSKRAQKCPVRIAVLERSDDPYAGGPYGLQVGAAPLLITRFRDFLPTQERARFAAWLHRNKSWAFDRLRQQDGTLTKRWWDENKTAVDHDEWDDLFLPRYLFGLYLRHVTQEALGAAEADRRVTHELIQGVATSLSPFGHDYLVEIGGEGAVTAGAAVLAIGSPSTRSRLKTTDNGHDQDVLLIDDPHQPGLAQNLDRIRRWLAARDRRDPVNVLIVGGNASAIEMIYLIADLPVWDARRLHFIVVSPDPLPERLDATVPAATFQPAALSALRDNADASPKAAAVYRAAKTDIERRRAAGLTISETLTPITRAVADLTGRLAPAERAAFANHWGAELGRLQRRVGGSYADVLETLSDQSRLHVLSGRFTRVSAVGPAGAVIECDVDGQSIQLPDRMGIVVNCAGSARLHDLARPCLLEQLLETGTCAATPSGRGLLVNDDMEANDNLFVIGPLLAGNVIRGDAVWHMEHCGRVAAFSAMLGRTLADRLVAP